MRHSLLYTQAGRTGSSLPLLQLIVNSNQIFQAEIRSTSSSDDERVWSSQIGPAGRQKAHMSVLVAVVNPILAPLPTPRDQIQHLSVQRMKWMGNTETCSRIARLKCIR